MPVPATQAADELLTRREALARLGLVGVGLVGAGALITGCGSDSKTSVGSGQASVAPNVLLIVADDMRYDDLEFVPAVRRLIADSGRAFTQARCNVPLCQPSRVALITGQMSKHNGEIGVGFMGTTLADHDNGIGRWMADAGYRCGFFGKYVNFTDGFGGIDAPAGWDTWREFAGGSKADDMAFDVHLNTGVVKIEGRYSSDYLADEASAFISRADGPFFCAVAPSQPHEPFRPRPDLADDWLDHRWSVVDEIDVSDKPPWIRDLPPLTEEDRSKIQSDVIGALQEISALDDMVERIITGMDPAVLAETLVIFTSDNGVHRGEHRRRGAGVKGGPYEVGLRVPLLVRGPGFEHGPDVTAPVMAFQDIAATILDAGDATAGLPHQSGLSLVEVTADPSRHRERLLLHEVGQGFEGQTGDGITTGPESSLGFRKLYRYPSVRQDPVGPYTYEAYDLDADPDELSNWAEDPARRAERDALEAELDALLR